MSDKTRTESNENGGNSQKPCRPTGHCRTGFEEVHEKGEH